MSDQKIDTLYLTDGGKVVPLNQPKTDAEKAADYKERSGKLIGEMLALQREAEREDFRIDFQLGRDQIGMPYAMGRL
jgi:hypothetical protein